MTYLDEALNRTSALDYRTSALDRQIGRLDALVEALNCLTRASEWDAGGDADAALEKIPLALVRPVARELDDAVIQAATHLRRIGVLLEAIQESRTDPTGSRERQSGTNEARDEAKAPYQARPPGDAVQYCVRCGKRFYARDYGPDGTCPNCGSHDCGTMERDVAVVRDLDPADALHVAEHIGSLCNPLQMSRRALMRVDWFAGRMKKAAEAALDAGQERVVIDDIDRWSLYEAYQLLKPDYAPTTAIGRALVRMGEALHRAGWPDKADVDDRTGQPGTDLEA